MQKTGIFDKIGKFFRRNAYYVLLIACICAVGTMVTLTVISESVDAGIEAPEDQGGVDVNASPDGGNNDSAVGGETNNDQEVGGTEQPKPDLIVFTAPVAEITGVKEYAMDTLVFSSTHNQWECHAGIDYFAPAGTEVVAVLAGTVQSVASDALHGNVITVDHGDGLITVYANLGEVSVEVGQTVKTGQVIGTVGNSGLIEIADGDHLHFETMLKGETVNPDVYFADGNK